VKISGLTIEVLKLVDEICVPKNRQQGKWVLSNEEIVLLSTRTYDVIASTWVHASPDVLFEAIRATENTESWQLRSHKIVESLQFQWSFDDGFGNVFLALIEKESKDRKNGVRVIVDSQIARLGAALRGELVARHYMRPSPLKSVLIEFGMGRRHFRNIQAMLEAIYEKMEEIT
jgi:hypothetical protein